MGWRDVVARLGGEDAAARTERRAQRLPTSELVDWVETTVPAIGKAFGDWMREGNPAGLDEARMGTAALQAVLEELDRRRAAGGL